MGADDGGANPTAAPRCSRSHARDVASAPDGTAARPTFITTWSCPYAQRTWIALNEKGVAYEPVHVDLKVCACGGGVA